MRTRFVLVALGLVFFGMNAAVAQDQEGPEIRALFPDIGSTGTRVVIVGKNLAAEYLPRVTIILGAIVSICRSSHLWHAFISEGSGSRFWGGRHFITLQI